MKRRAFRMLVVLAAVVVVVMAGCPSSGSSHEFDGTWTALGIETWQFGSSGGTLSVNLVFSYTINFTYTSVDQGAKHILLNITTVSGTSIPPGLTINTPLYVTYSITGTTPGSSMYADFDQSAYPATASSGPYIKQ